jgi:hypothetical protein
MFHISSFIMPTLWSWPGEPTSTIWHQTRYSQPPQLCRKRAAEMVQPKQT